MDHYNRPAPPGLYMIWGAAAVIGFVMIYGLAEVIVDWIAPPPEATEIVAPTE